LKNGIIINVLSFWPFFPASQRILWPGLSAVKHKLLPLKIFWIKIFPIFKLAGQGGSFQNPGSLITQLKREAREN
jgi:hypothetical protein